VWDGQVCYYGCTYCFANYFRDSLYTNFFDNVPKGLRKADWPELEKALKWLASLRGTDKPGARPSLPAGDVPAVIAAFRAGVPVRIGVRFENFLPQEKRDGLTLRVLRLLSELQYPVIIDTKSTLVAEDEYIEALASNKAGAVVQVSLSGVNAELFKKLEPGAPSPIARFEALGRLNAAGIQGTPRIEPFLPFLADSKEEITEYIDRARAAGVKWICWDAFSHSTSAAATRRLFHIRGWDFDRMFFASSDSRLLTGLLLGSMMDHFRGEGFKCSTYDDMNSCRNDDWLCCNVSEVMDDPAPNWASTKAMEQYVKEQAGDPVGWAEYERHVNTNGGFLTESLADEVRHLWNNEGNQAYSLAWLGLDPAGRDLDGLTWRWTGSNPNMDRAVEWIESESD
jgi:DNA repair photolyase